MPSPRAINADAPGIAISVTSTASTSVPLPNQGSSVRLVNEGTSNCYVSIGSGSQIATVPSGTALRTCLAVMAGEDCLFTIPDSAVLNISAICAGSGTATLDVYVGEGN